MVMATAAAVTGDPDRFIEEEDLKKKPRGRACDQIRYDLKACLMNSDCVKKGLSPKECLVTHSPDVPDECFELRQSFFECKRSIIDMRSRFRGRKGE